MIIAGAVFESERDSFQRAVDHDVFSGGKPVAIQFNLGVCAKTNVGQEAQFKQNALTLTLSRPTGEGTTRSVSCTFYSGWIGRPTEDDSPSPIRWEREGVRVSPSQNPKLFLHES